jgi:hypothetical protein
MEYSQKKDSQLIQRCTFRVRGSVVALSLAYILSMNGCSVCRAVGDTVESVGTGAGRVLTGFASGTGHAIAGTGRAISNAAGRNPMKLKGLSEPSKASYDEEVRARYDDRNYEGGSGEPTF